MPDPFHRTGNPVESQTGFLVKPPTEKHPEIATRQNDSAGSGLMLGLNALVRGLNAMFYTLPVALLITVWTATRSSAAVPSPFGDLLYSMGILPALSVALVMFYGVTRIGRYQPKNRSWQASVDRGRWYALFLIGLSPFLYWWCRMPENLHFRIAAMTLIIIGMLFLVQLNIILRRLTQTLPDQTLRSETAFMSRFNIGVLALVALAQVFFFSLNRLSVSAATLWLSREQLWLLRPVEIIVLLLMVLPVAITMAVMWKIKELILASVFQSDD